MSTLAHSDHPYFEVSCAILHNTITRLIPHLITRVLGIRQCGILKGAISRNVTTTAYLLASQMQYTSSLP